ncbi:MAG: leucyl aminopeptidase [Helicobacteraceae bacterium]|nr:leucyl aminopeptidase [Helicobacteraceae bacterium]
MQLELKQQPLTEIEAELLVTFLTPDLLETHPHKEVLSRAGFKAESDSICALHAHSLVVVGIDNFEADTIRSATATMIKAIKAYSYKSAKLFQYNQENTFALVEGILLGEYSFNDYKSDPKKSELKNIYLSNDNFNAEELDQKRLLEDYNSALVIAKATNFTRDLVNTIPNDMTPQALAVVARDLADENNLECTILDEHALEQENMNAMLAVGRASVHKPRLIHLTYKPHNPQFTLSLVGKGLTYDSGGMSLKPATSMVTMKMDKAGACAVLGMMKAVSELKLPIEVHGLIGAAENMVNGNAYKPDDVLTSKNGKTIEVRNTDAEGRLVLADVLTYTQEKIKSDYIFDFATLTGACMVALGQYTTGVMGHSHRLKHQFFQASVDSGELVASLPFNRHLKKLIKSEIADICNVASKPYGGAITAALFLESFIDENMKDKWLHFDIAGSAYSESSWDCNNYGATGAGVRLTIEWMRQQLNEPTN